MSTLPSPQQLRYLLTLAEFQHFGRAAVACAVTQSTLSAGLIALERQLDAQIIDRTTGKRVIFTPLGRELVERARQAMTALEAVVETAAAARSPMGGPLRIGLIPTLGPFLLPRLMPILRQAYPQLKLFLREDMTDRLVDHLESNRLDLLLLALPCACGPAETMPVSRDEFVAAVPVDHPLAAQEYVAPQALAQERLLLLEEGHCLREQALAVCGVAGGTKPGGQDFFAATSLHTLVQMVAGGLGVTLLPRLAVDGDVMAGAQLALRPIAGGEAWRTIGMAWRLNSPRTGDFRALAPSLAAAISDPPAPSG